MAREQEVYSAQRRALVLAAGVAPFLAATGCANLAGGEASLPTPQGIPAPTVKLGDRWVYEDVNQYNRTVVGQHEAQVMSIGTTLQLERKTSASQLSAPEIYQPAWMVLQETFYDQVQLFERPVAVVPASLNPGATPWSYTHYRVAGIDQRLFWNEQLSVLRWERVKVPAGEFEVAVIERRIRFQHSDYARQHNTRVDRIWYSPQIQRWVQREWTGQFLWGGRPRSPGREDWVLSRLVRYQAA